VAAIKELIDGLGAHSVVEAVGTQQSMDQALHATRPGGLQLPLEEAGEGYRAMDRREAIKTLLRP
jgi:hypothetical protein